MSKIQTLGLSNRNSTDKIILKEDLIVFDKLARWNNNDGKGNDLLTLNRVDQWLLKILTYDLGLKYDDNIVLNLTIYHTFMIDLSDTNYTEDEKANIYYIFYGINQFRPYYSNGAGHTVHVAGDNYAQSYEFNGIGSYWIKTKDSFFGSILNQTEIEDQKSFADSFHLLSLFYLALNGYRNYKDAENHKFEIHDAS